eukprot:g1264.t1
MRLEALHLLTWVLRYDPGGLRLVRGLHLMVTVLVCVLLANGLAGFQSGVSAFTMAVLTAAAGSHCLIFTPVSTRRQEMASILRMGLVVTVLFGVGALIGTLSGKAAMSVLQLTWAGVIALGFALDGIGGFWQRTGRAISIFWLFVILSSQPASPGLWLPVLAMLGTIVAFVVRIGLWRPSSESTYLSVEAANRQALADHLEEVTNALGSTRKHATVPIRELARLRMELQLCIALIGPAPSARGLSTETATMMELALEVVRDAAGHLTGSALASLRNRPGFSDSLGKLSRKLRTGEASDQETLDISWADPDPDLEVQDQFQILRIAQSFKRLWLLAERGNPVEDVEQAATAGSSGAWYNKLDWRLALQGGVAALLGLAIGWFFELSHAYWVTLTVVVILCNRLGSTVQKTVQRVGGTAAGVCLAIIIDPLLSGLPDLRLALIVLSIPAIVVFMDRNYAVAAGFISFMVVAGLHAIVGLPIGELWVRLWDTMIGAGVGLSVAWILFPNRTGDTITSLTKAYLSACANVLKEKNSTATDDQQDFADLRRSASNLVKTARSYRAEVAPWSSYSEATSDLDVLVIVLGHYVILYRQARSVVLKAAVGTEEPAIRALVARMDVRVENEIAAVLDGREKQAEPGLAGDWLAAMPEVETAGPQLMTNWVAMLYHARKIVRCLDGLRRGGLLQTAADLAPPIAGTFREN